LCPLPLPQQHYAIVFNAPPPLEYMLIFSLSHTIVMSRSLLTRLCWGYRRWWQCDGSLVRSRGIDLGWATSVCMMSGYYLNLRPCSHIQS
jgi:hypothetical protein